MFNSGEIKLFATVTPVLAKFKSVKYMNIKFVASQKKPAFLTLALRAISFCVALPKVARASKVVVFVALRAN